MVRSVLGGIDLDPASCEMAQKVVQAKKYYTVKESGLLHPWAGRVFLNPPYSVPLIQQFTDKLLKELPNIESAILLTNDQTDTLWWQKCAAKAAAVCFNKGRVGFYTPERARTAPTNGQTFQYFGPDPERFAEVFRDTGTVMSLHGSNGAKKLDQAMADLRSAFTAYGMTRITQKLTEGKKVVRDGMDLSITTGTGEDSWRLAGAPR
jgi:hypothetical protein